MSSMRVKPSTRRAPTHAPLLRSVAIDHLPPGNTPHHGLGAAGLVLGIGAVVQAGVHVRAEEDRVVRTAVVAHARVRGIRVTVLVVARVADIARIIDVEEGIAQAATGERVDRHGEALAAGRARIGRIREARGADQGHALEEIRHHHSLATGGTAGGLGRRLQVDVPTVGTRSGDLLDHAPLASSWVMLTLLRSPSSTSESRSMM